MALAQHGLVLSAKADRSLLHNGVVQMRVGTDSSSLCQHYLMDRHPCEHCPLAHIREGTPCDVAREEFEERSPFDIWVDEGDPRGMLYWLRIAGKRGDV